MTVTLGAGVQNRIMTIAGAALLAGLATLFAPHAARAQGTPEQRQACTDDAFRLCQATIPDAGRTKACLLSNMRRLSPACRVAFGRGPAVRTYKRTWRAHRARHRAVHHHRRHRR